MTEKDKKSVFIQTNKSLLLKLTDYMQNAERLTDYVGISTIYPFALTNKTNIITI